jgi:hypothetical protein
MKNINIYYVSDVDVIVIGGVDDVNEILNEIVNANERYALYIYIRTACGRVYFF